MQQDGNSNGLRRCWHFEFVLTVIGLPGAAVVRVGTLLVLAVVRPVNGSVPAARGEAEAAIAAQAAYFRLIQGVSYECTATYTLYTPIQAYAAAMEIRGLTMPTAVVGRVRLHDRRFMIDNDYLAFAPESKNIDAFDGVTWVSASQYGRYLRRATMAAGQGRFPPGTPYEPFSLPFLWARASPSDHSFSYLKSKTDWKSLAGGDLISATDIGTTGLVLKLKQPQQGTGFMSAVGIVTLDRTLGYYPVAFDCYRDAAAEAAGEAAERIRVRRMAWADAHGARVPVPGLLSVSMRYGNDEHMDRDWELSAVRLEDKIDPREFRVEGDIPGYLTAIVRDGITVAYPQGKAAEVAHDIWYKNVQDRLSGATAGAARRRPPSSPADRVLPSRFAGLNLMLGAAGALLIVASLGFRLLNRKSGRT